MAVPVEAVLRILATAVLGFALGAAALHVYRVNTGPGLQPWHTADLDEELTSRTPGIVTLADYLALEARLFDQLGREVYARTETGPSMALARYSRGSAADPGSRGQDWNRTYELPTPEPQGAVLLLHGLTDSPYSLRAIGEAFHRRGFHVLGLRLPGHGTAPAALSRVRWEDWAAAVRLAMRHLDGVVPGGPIHVVGYSAGGALAVDYALDALDDEALPRARTLTLISPALGVTPMAALARWNARVARIPGLRKLAWQSILPEFDPFKYNSFPVNAGDQIYRLTRRIARSVRERAREGPVADLPPTLVFVSAVDATVSVAAAVDDLLRHLAPGRAELVVFDVNRRNVTSTILASDPGPLTRALLDADDLPFTLTLLTNTAEDSDSVVTRTKGPRTATTAVDTLEMAWPTAFLSLSHVALPFPPDDPLYGATPPPGRTFFLGDIPIRGERGLLRFPESWLLRIRHNPFYGYLESRTVEWAEGT